MSDRARADAVKDRVEADLLARPGVTGVATGPKVVGGVATGTWSIRVYVERKHDVASDDALPGEIDGVPVDVIERRFVPHSPETGSTGEEGG